MGSLSIKNCMYWQSSIKIKLNEYTVRGAVVPAVRQPGCVHVFGVNLTRIFCVCSVVLLVTPAPYSRIPIQKSCARFIWNHHTADVRLVQLCFQSRSVTARSKMFDIPTKILLCVCVFRDISGGSKQFWHYLLVSHYNKHRQTYTTFVVSLSLAV